MTAWFLGLGDVPPCRSFTGLFESVGDSAGPGSHREMHVIRSVCRQCPFADRCLTWAIDNDEVWGIWGGHTYRERQAMKRDPEYSALHVRLARRWAERARAEQIAAERAARQMPHVPRAENRATQLG